MGATEVLPHDAKSIVVSPETPDSPFSPPYRSDTCVEHKLVQLQAPVRMRLEAGVQSLHQEALMKLVRKVHSCPEPIPRLITLNCPPCHTEELRSERIHAVIQLLAQIRENQHQAQLRKAYREYGQDNRKAAKELYAREQFAVAYTQYWSMFTCLSCDKCREMSAGERHSVFIDLLEKLAVTCIRAGWLADAENFAREALECEKRSTRARMWLATAQLGLGKLEEARRNLGMLPRRGGFPAEFPGWIEARVGAQREVLARLEREARGVFDVGAMEMEAPDCTPGTPHSTGLFQIEATPAGYRTVARVGRGALLLVAAPVACAPCYTAEPVGGGGGGVAPPPPRTAESGSYETMDRSISLEAASSSASPPLTQTGSHHLPPIPQDDDPNSLFSLAMVADSVFEQVKAANANHAYVGAQGQGQLQEEEEEPEPVKKPRTLHEEDPSLLSLGMIADTLYTQAKVLPLVRFPLRAAAARCRKEGEQVIDLVGNELRAAAILVAQNYTLSIPHAPGVGVAGSCGGGAGAGAAAAAAAGSFHPRRSAGNGGGGGHWMELPCEKPVHAGHGLYLASLKLLSASLPNTYATFHGPYLFLRAKTDLRAGTLLTFNGFPGAIAPPPISTSSRGRVTALTSSPATLSSPSSSKKSLRATRRLSS